MDTSKAIVLLMPSDGLGKTSDQKLREKLVGTLLRLLEDAEELPKAICFFTDGVKLACEGSPILKELAALEAKGVRLVLCNTCLNQFGLVGEVRVGVVGGMTDIITAMWGADSVITL